MTLPRVVLFILQKTTRSIQRHLHDFLYCLDKANAHLQCTAGAWSQARAKLSHRAFVELNDELLIPMAYGAEDLAERPKLWRGRRRKFYSVKVAIRFGMVQRSSC